MPHLNLQKILFLDIETVGEVATYGELPTKKQELWDKKTAPQRDITDPATWFLQKAGIQAEFGKVICISCGYRTDTQHTAFKKQSFAGDDEKQLLTDFGAMLTKLSASYLLCAHNGKEFDFPYLARRMLINGVPLPHQLHVASKKPRETSFLDTMEMRKFGDHKHFTSLDLLASLFDIPSPKDDISGSDVHRVYREERDIERIIIYCEKDVETVAKVYERLLGGI